MKSSAKILSLIALLTVSTLSVFANTTGVKAPLNQLVPIEMELEEAVEDVHFSPEEELQYIKLEVSPLSPDSLETEEKGVFDVKFNEAEIKKHIRLLITESLKKLIPIGEEKESGVEDFLTL